MKRATLALTLSLVASASLAGDLPGFVTFEVPKTENAPSFEAAIWYPGSGGKKAAIGNAVFSEVPLLQDATVEPGQHPVVLLSHGLGGNYRSLGWLGADLARRGAVVIAVNHPSSTTGDIQMSKAFSHWTRGQDLERALIFVESDKRFAASLDPARIYAAGFSFGGWTALSIAGVRGNIAGFADYCSGKGAGSTHCADIAKWGVNLRGQNAATWDASYKNARIKAVAAIDPAFTFGIDTTRIAEVSAKVLMIGLGKGTDRLDATDFSESGSNFGAVFEKAQKLDIAAANHFTALNLCRPEGAVRLAEENDDPVCTDPPGTDRAVVHQTIANAIARHFGLR
jgi:predicted dienelactone hydrolase